MPGPETAGAEFSCCTGHSLGGALATLAAYAIRKACPCLACTDISCYTFGAPRTGNHAFAWDYNDIVPDTWGMINDQDAVVSQHCHEYFLMPSTSGNDARVFPSAPQFLIPVLQHSPVQVRNFSCPIMHACVRSRLTGDDHPPVSARAGAGRQILVAVQAAGAPRDHQHERGSHCTAQLH